jgi:ABC-2 type transport system ATP-binding protein
MTNSTHSPHVIDVAGLRKEYGGRSAIDGIDLHVDRGECVALLGPNGAGKTTTVEILEGFRTRDAGSVTVLDADPAAAGRAWRARIGVVLQTATDNGDLTVAEVVRHFACYYPNPRNPDEVITSVGLDTKRHDRLDALSGGQRRRLDVALGIIGRPELLFLDEPTTGFDPEARRQFWSLITTLKESGTTILLTTHYLDEAEHLADRVAVISQGRVLATDTPANLTGGAPTVVSWRGADGVAHAVPTDEPTRLLRQLTTTFPDGEIAEISVKRPSLEDVYIDMLEREGVAA